ncbi:tyrosine-type recombinase/integrase [Bacillus glycinifermentans]|uniref:Integrase/recombinase YoeC n=1 Tax=Bacillus sonorensis TaxID=119858 RepID=A0ABM6LEP5_9BACI|nr:MULTISPECIES: tyrosine-type recombinase/integrase [Bacillus]ASB87728.1 putative integrase/recombinase YoeC [Bacillus sonorensis]MBU8785682.1 tyrosine-type recombinase/integrase [Bacillus glycinifermentans]NUJ19581.1 tyrosine-type recombinase/integrase [Bacillus glycinifermentans]
MANEVFPIKSKRDYNKFIKALKPGRDRNLGQLGTAFGLRISDLLKFKIGELRGHKSITIWEKKRKKKRLITFSPSVLKIVNQLEGDDDDYVFASRQGGGKPITRVQAYRILNDAAKRAGIYEKIGGIGTHSLRKTFGYRLYENGVDITRIMSILNHSSERETLRYIGITADEISEAYESIEV